MNPNTRDPESRPRAMSDEEATRILTAIKKGGDVNFQDPRVSQFQTWLIGAIGFGMLGLGTWMTTSINSLNETVGKLVVTNEYLNKSIDDINRRVENIEHPPERRQ